MSRVSRLSPWARQNIQAPLQNNKKRNSLVGTKELFLSMCMFSNSLPRFVDEIS